MLTDDERNANEVLGRRPPKVPMGRYMAFQFECNMAAGGSLHNSRVVATILASTLYQVTQHEAQEVFDKEVRTA